MQLVIAIQISHSELVHFGNILSKDLFALALFSMIISQAFLTSCKPQAYLFEPDHTKKTDPNGSVFAIIITVLGFFSALLYFGVNLGSKLLVIPRDPRNYSVFQSMLFIVGIAVRVLT